VPRSTAVVSSPGCSTRLRSGELAVCFNIIRNYPMLDLPELFVPKNTVIGASRSGLVSRQPLKFLICSAVIIMVAQDLLFSSSLRQTVA